LDTLWLITGSKDGINIKSRKDAYELGGKILEEGENNDV
jgi:hypothetical protein